MGVFFFGLHKVTSRSVQIGSIFFDFHDFHWPCRKISRRFLDLSKSSSAFPQITGFAAGKKKKRKKAGIGREVKGVRS